ncbi:MAG: hypothetical protein HN742_11620 [Lentisphaerae bacterium]|nr:hypothetical protein [Lentisphaerota bacterium]MBT4820467.1 hypothetical protein [Lentisphaerota bacterium]MBT5609601.1 hypothetical protein [Lentisphaerota bacterium]MBT7060889.1 hypothetical protein [Lentisphaerota bacterium]MBT7842516.1 hypothetical protein [Lentisphaerota bacterium]
MHGLNRLTGGIGPALFAFFWLSLGWTVCADGGPLGEGFARANHALAVLEAAPTLTLGQATEARELQAELKAAIEELPRAEWMEWEEAFESYLERSDRITASKPLLVPLSAIHGLIVRSPADFLLRLTHRYKLMDESGGNVDFGRFAGVDADDLIGVEKLEEHHARRTLGETLAVPGFALISPYGVLQFVDRLVRKYGQASTPEGQGLQDVATEDLLRYIDGTKLAFDEMAARARSTLVTLAPVPEPGALRVDGILSLMEAFATLNTALLADVDAVLATFAGEEPFEVQLRREFAAALGGNLAPDVAGYGPRWRQFESSLWDSPFGHRTDIGEVHVSKGTVNMLTNRLPGTVSHLLRYPGIAELLVRDDFRSLTSATAYAALSQVDVVGHVPPPADLSLGDDVAEDGATLALPARRFQLLALLLDAWHEDVVGPDGEVDVDVFWSNLVLDDDLEEMLRLADVLIEEGRSRLRLFRAHSLSEEDYSLAKGILVSVRGELIELLQPALADVIGDAWGEVTNRVAGRFQDLVGDFRELTVLAHSRVAFESGEELVFDPRRLKASVLDALLDASSLKDSSGRFHREAFLRLNGVDEHVLEDLLSPYDLERMLSFSFHAQHMISGRADTFAEEELLFRLVPRLVGRFGVAVPDELRHHLASGLPLLVKPGHSLEAVVKGIVREECRRALTSLSSRSPGDLEGLLAGRECLRELSRTLRERLEPFIDPLPSRDVGALESWINWTWNEAANVRAVRERFDQTIAGVSSLRQGDVLVPVRDVLHIPAFPWSSEYDRELFVGLAASDFAGAETRSEADAYRYFRFGAREGADPEALSQLGRIQVVVTLVERLLRAASSSGQWDHGLRPIFFLRNGVLYVEVEQLRLHVKGVRAMVARVEAAAREIGEEAEERLIAERSPRYTIAAIMEQHEEIVLGSRLALLELLEDEASKHERRDVILAESPVSQLFQHHVFDVLGANVAAGDLVVEYDGADVSVPVEGITLVLLGHLRDRVRGDLAAHHFALLPGISLGLVRGLHRLEDYMGEQVIALPRTSEYVQITSQISELGYMQLASHIVSTFAEDLIDPDTSTVVLERVLSTLSDTGRARECLYQELAAIRDRVVTELGELPLELDLEALAALRELLDDAKVELARLPTDFVTGLDLDGAALEELAGELELFINALYGEIKEERDLLLDRALLVYSVWIGDAPHVIECPLDDSTVGRFIAFADGIAGTGPEVSAGGGSGFSAICTDVFCFPASSSGRMVTPFWSPVPPVTYDPGHHPTRFGMTLAFARLLVRYGQFALAETEGQVAGVSMDAFLLELEHDDTDRARRRIDAIRDRELPAIEAFIESLRADDGSLSVAELAGVAERLLAIRERLVVLSEDAFEEARDAWSAFVELYEGSLFDAVLSVETAEGGARFDGRVLDEVLMRAYHSGRIDVERLVPFLEMIENGETTWDYSRFRSLPYRYWDWWSDGDFFSFGGQEGGIVDATGGGTDSAAGAFTLGDLAALPGVDGPDLNGVDVSEKDRLVVTPGDAAQLLGLLNIRAISPGSGVDGGGWLDSTKAGVAADEAIVGGANEEVELREAFALEEKSYRFRVFELLPGLVLEAGRGVLDEVGVVIPAEFAAYLAGDVTNGTAEQDLVPLEEGADVAAVDCTAGADDPVLLELCRKTAMQVAGPEPGFAHVHAYPWRSHLPGVGRLFFAEDEFDIVVDVSFLAMPEDQDALFAALREAFVAQWFAADVVRLAPRPMWLAVPSRKRLPGRQSLVLGIVLARTDAVRSYWRVTVPVARLIGDEASVDPELGSGSFVRVEDILVGAAADETPGAGPAPEHRLGGTQVTILFRNLDAPDGQEGRESVGGACESVDVVPIRPGETRSAIGFLPILSATREESDDGEAVAVRIEVIADPEDRVAEVDEENNGLILTVGRKPEPQGRFRARAVLIPGAEAAEDSVAVLARLTCLGHRALVLQFPSALQLDVALGDSFIWSTQRVFTQALTRVVVAPGETHEWRVDIPLSDVDEDVEALLSVRAFLVGTEYEAVTDLLFLPVPSDVDGVADRDRLFKPSPEEAGNGGWTDDVIVGDPADSVLIDIPPGSGGPAELALLHVADGASVTASETGLFIGPGESFLGHAYVAFDVLRDGRSEAESRSIRVGPQEFTLHVRSGWNMVSLPIVPFEPLDELLGRVSSGVAWAWRDGSYDRVRTAEPGVGFWLYCESDAELSFVGDPTSREDVELAPGWHLLGSVNDRDVPEATGVGAVFEWRKAAYGRAPDLRNGSAYWFLITEETRLSLD